MERSTSNRFQDLVNAASVGIEERAKARDARVAAQPEKTDCECIHCGAPGVDLCCAACFREGQ